MDFKTWINACLAGFAKYDCKNIEKLLFKQKVLNLGKSEDVRNAVREILSEKFNIEEGNPEIWVNFLSEHLDVKSRKHQCFRHLNSAFQSLVSIFNEDDEGYLLFPVIKLYSRRLLKEGSKSSTLDEVINSFRKLIGSCQNNKPLPDSHVIGLIFSINISIKTCFRLNNLQQLPSLLRIVNNPNSRFPKLLSYPKSQQVELKYYEGKNFLYENDFEEAANSFEQAYNKCKNIHFENTKKILMFLVPLNACLGKYASDELMTRFKLKEYSELLKYLRTGNIVKVEEFVQSRQEDYLKSGTIILMDFLRFVAYKNLFKKLQRLLKTQKISFNIFEHALEIAGVENMTRSRLVSVFNSLAAKELLQVKLDLVNGFAFF
jgi:tetratricopeptide (TPR) repeat protein